MTSQRSTESSIVRRNIQIVNCRKGHEWSVALQIVVDCEVHCDSIIVTG
jgi:hypothetical protein